MRYFKSRLEAGSLLAEQIVPKYNHKTCAVVALSDGSVMVGAQIALGLKCVLTMLLTESIVLPRENEAAAVVGQDGQMVYNALYSTGEIEELQGEFRNYIEGQRIEKIHQMNTLLKSGNLIRRDLLTGHNVILVSDGLNDGSTLDAAADFMKSVPMTRLIVATPLASVSAVDRMHVLADEIFCIDVVTDYISTSHYYETQDVPDHDAVVRTIQSVVRNWRQPPIANNTNQSTSSK
jgi:putative phosphoribosyl transferase